MATVRYIGPVHPEPPDENGNQAEGRVSVPLLGRDVGADEVVEVPDEWLEEYGWAPELWETSASSDDPRTVKELKAELVERGLSTTGNKADLLDRLAQEPAATTTNDGE